MKRFFKIPPRRLWPRCLFLWRQRITRGWDDSDTWALDDTFVRWFLPRLRRYRELTNGYPGNLNSAEEWDEILGKIVWALDQHQIDDWHLHLPEEERPKVDEGFMLLGRWLQAMWW